MKYCSVKIWRDDAPPIPQPPTVPQPSTLAQQKRNGFCMLDILDKFDPQRGKRLAWIKEICSNYLIFWFACIFVLLDIFIFALYFSRSKSYKKNWIKTRLNIWYFGLRNKQIPAQKSLFLTWSEWIGLYKVQISWKGQKFRKNLLPIFEIT